MLLSLVLAAMPGGGSPGSGLPVDGAPTTARTAGQNAPVAVPPAGERAMASPRRDGRPLVYADRFKK